MLPPGFARLIADLSEPSAYPHPIDRVEARQTHISVVFLAGDRVYKLKKPVDLGFLDFTTLERRRHFCEEEVRLNRRLAAAVYRGVVPIVKTADGHRLGGAGEPVEYAVHMARLPDGARLTERLAQGTLAPELLDAVAARIAAFHRVAAPATAHFEAVATSLRENFTGSRAQAGTLVAAAVWQRAQELVEQALESVRPLIEARSARARDGHGDLHLDHIYHLPEREPPESLPIIDCVEFSPRLRQLDPVADIAFLAMDLGFRGRRDLAEHFVRAWAVAAGEVEGLALLPLYAAYRTLVRAKVNGLGAGESEIPAAERESLAHRARAHWLYALDLLELPRRRPGLVLIGGLPGSGKSTLARALAESLGFEVIVADRVRKELAAGATDLYTAEWNERTYGECLRRAESRLSEGGRVIVDASFREERRRGEFLALSRRLALRARLLLCHAPETEVLARLAARQGDVSDADGSVHLRLKAAWEPLAVETAGHTTAISTCSREAASHAATALLALLGLV